MAAADTPLVRIYGPGTGHTSWCRVVLGMRRGLDAIGQLAGFYEVSEAVHDNDTGMGVGYDAPVGVFVGSPAHATIITNRGRHERRLIMVAANSSWLPSVAMAKLAEVATGFVAPSRWAAEVVRQYSHGLPVSVWRHGVDDAFSPRTLLPVMGGYQVLHLSSSTKERKGSADLIRAWIRLQRQGKLPDYAMLRMVLPTLSAEHEMREVARQESAGFDYLHRGISFFPPGHFTEMDAALAYGNHHLICQPSRAEGFGLVPLEARCCGVPVCATVCTGHSEHMVHGDPGVRMIHHGPYEPIDDGPGAMAPSVSADSIADSLAWCYEHRDELRSEAFGAAEQLRKRWSWKKVCSEWFDEHGQAG